jgi:hypothetical protein
MVFERQEVVCHCDPFDHVLQERALAEYQKHVDEISARNQAKVSGVVCRDPRPCLCVSSRADTRGWALAF